MSNSRQLAAIMFSDLVGYTRLMGRDSKKALELLSRAHGIQQNHVENHNGKWLKEMGDGVMVQFATALDAVNCAVNIQLSTSNDPEIKLRIGIHLGDITIKDGDIFGDGVNVASRLESIADPGGIYISDSVEKAIRGQFRNESKLLGELKLKNVDYLVKTYAIQGPGLPLPVKFKESIAPSSKSSIYKRSVYIMLAIILLAGTGYILYSLVLGKEGNEKFDSIAVLAFADHSENQNLSYIGDGIADELINSLGRFDGLKVIGRTSSFSYKGTDYDLNEIGADLNVTSILEGSVKRFGELLRINTRLIDVIDGSQMWGRQYDIEPEMIYSIQDEIGNEVSKVLGVDLNYETTDFVPDPLAFDHYLKGLDASLFDSAVYHFKKSLSISPQFEQSLLGLGWEYFHKARTQTSGTKLYFMNEALICMRNAIKLNPNSSGAFRLRGDLMKHTYLNAEISLEDFEKAIDLNPSNVQARMSLLYTFVEIGDFKSASEQILKVRSLEPNTSWNALNYYYNLFNPDSTINYENDFFWIENRIKFRQYDSLYLDAKKYNYRPYYAFARVFEGGLHDAFRIADSLNQQTDPWDRIIAAAIYSNGGRKSDGLDILQDLRKTSPINYLIILKVSHMFLPLREEPEFLDLLQSLGLGEYPLIFPE